MVRTDLNISWDDLRFFLVCYRGGSATAAARELKTTVSTVSRRLDRMEKSLGVVLFLRGVDGLTPTEEAVRLVDGAQEAERCVVQAIAGLQDSQSEVQGRVRIASSSDIAHFVLLPLLPDLVEQYPKLAIDFVLGRELSDLARREADLAVRIGHPGDGVELVVRQLRKEPMSLFASARYLEKYPASLPAQRHRWLLISESVDAEMTRWSLKHFQGISVFLWSNDYSSVRLAAGAGMGVALLPDTYGYTTPGLVRLDWGISTPQTSLFLVSHQSARKNPAVRAVWDFIARLLSDSAPHDHIALLRQALSKYYGMSDWTTAANHKSVK